MLPAAEKAEAQSEEITGGNDNQHRLKPFRLWKPSHTQNMNSISGNSPRPNLLSFSSAFRYDEGTWQTTRPGGHFESY